MNSPTAMTALERRSSFSLASIFALRMLGLFLVLPVFMLEARHYEGAHSTALVGQAMGIYGLTQALLQIPLGMAADRWGRKRVMVLGLLVFAAGSVIAAMATSIQGLMLGRAVQGAGAISAAVTALLADQTRDVVRTKAMALVGGSIALMFSVSLVAAPWMAAQVGLSGLFVFTAVLALAGVAVTLWWVPAETGHSEPERGSAQRVSWARDLVQVVLHPHLWRLYVGVFMLHAIQLAMWVSVPALLVQAGLEKAQHWQMYLPIVLVSFLAVGAVFSLERRGYLRAVFLSAIACIAVAQLGGWWMQYPGALMSVSLMGVGAVLLVFFCGFNILEATQPSLVSRLAPAHLRATALGVYNTLQSLGFFTGGALGAAVAQNWGGTALFLACTALALVWLCVAWPMSTPARVPASAPNVPAAG